jgi:hypothetical protein
LAQRRVVTFFKDVIHFYRRTAMLNGILFFVLSAAITATPCENLTNLQLSDTTITSAAVVPEGPPPRIEGFRGFPGRPPRADIPAHCRVQLDLRPTSDSLIKMELWLPTENWNGKFMGVGNGFFAGSIQGKMFDMPDTPPRVRTRATKSRVGIGPSAILRK